MIVFNNNKDEPINILINEKTLTVKEHCSLSFECSDNELNFTVCEQETEVSLAARFFGALMIVLLSLILMIFEYDEAMYSKIQNFISLPIKVKLTEIDGVTTVVIDNSRANFYFAEITANCNCEYDIVYDNMLIERQVKQYRKECLLSLCIPLAILLIFTIFAVTTKDIIVIGIAVFLLAVAFYIWYYHHRRNQKTIRELLSKTDS